MSKVIAITGAGSGLGRALARSLAARGETVILLGRTLSRIEAVAAELGGDAFAIACDITSPDSVRAAFARIAERSPRLDVLVNNAAFYEPSLLAEASDKHIFEIINTNLIGAMLCARSAIPLMGPGGHIINISSESVEVPFAHLVVYQVSKAGLERFSLSLHRELEPSGVRVTLIRAGQMYEDGWTWEVDPQVVMRFVQANIEAGLKIPRPSSQFTSVTGVIHAVIDLPADVHTASIHIQARDDRAGREPAVLGQSATPG